MAEYKAVADKETSSTEKKYSVFFGRWQPFHKGHYWLINERLKEGKNVWVAIRDVKPDEQNPWTAQEVLNNLSIELLPLIQEGRVFISIVPDIESINYGRVLEIMRMLSGSGFTKVALISEPYKER